jgi:diacylglycerol kinase (ATP)
MKTRFIFNPHSGKCRRRPELLPAIHAFIAEQKLEADVVLTEGPGHATELARQAVFDDCARVVAVGGDGTMNEVSQALIDRPAALGLVPCGSGNGLALHLGIPTHTRRALALLADPRSRVVAIDTGSANGHPFCNAMGIGFDAEISRRFNRLPRRGLPAYARAGLAAFARAKSQCCVISNDEQRHRFDAFVVAVANSDQYGNNAFIAPRALVDDGGLDLVAIGSVNFFTALPLVARLFLGTIDRSPRVLRLHGERFLIERPTPGLVHTDGETHETAAAVEVRVHSRSLRVVVPYHSRVRLAPRLQFQPLAVGKAGPADGAFHLLF